MLVSGKVSWLETQSLVIHLCITIYLYLSKVVTSVQAIRDSETDPHVKHSTFWGQLVKQLN